MCSWLIGQLGAVWLSVGVFGDSWKCVDNLVCMHWDRCIHSCRSQNSDIRCGQVKCCLTGWYSRVSF